MNSNRVTLKEEAAIRRKIKPKTEREGMRMLPRVGFEPLSTVPLYGLYRRIKRGLDLILASVLMVLLLPVVVLAMVLVRLTSRGPAIYVQVRLGQGGVPFPIYKIRTMIDNCESLTGPRWAIPGDPRITPVGYVLRATHIDELPQLWNVIRGDMSLIGPRPERPEIAEKLVQDIPRYYERLAVKPGITGLAQVQLPPDNDVTDVAAKLLLDLAYIDRMGFGLDLRILLCTLFKLLTLRPDRYRVIIKSAIPAHLEPNSLLRQPRRAG